MVNVTNKGRCAITLDPKDKFPGQQPYQGVVPLHGDRKEKLAKLSDVVSHPFKVGFSDGIQLIFLLAAAVMVIGLIVVLFLPEVPLQQRSAQQQRADDAAAAAASDGVPGEVGAGPEVETKSSR